MKPTLRRAPVGELAPRSACAMSTPAIANARPTSACRCRRSGSAACDLPEPDGPISATKSPARDVEVDVDEHRHDLPAAHVGLGQVADRDDQRRGLGMRSAVHFAWPRRRPCAPSAQLRGGRAARPCRPTSRSPRDRHQLADLAPGVDRDRDRACRRAPRTRPCLPSRSTIAVGVHREQRLLLVGASPPARGTPPSRSSRAGCAGRSRRSGPWSSPSPWRGRPSARSG